MVEFVLAPEIPLVLSGHRSAGPSLPRRGALGHRVLGHDLVLLLTDEENTPLCLKGMRMNKNCVSKLL